MDTQTDITDKQILQSLLSKKERLEGQLTKVNIAIDAFGEDTIKATPSAQQSLIPQSARDDDNSKLNLSLPSQYDPNLSYPDKVLFVVGEKRGALVEEIVSYIANIEKTTDLEALKQRITQVASKMGRNDRLTFKKYGRKYKYFLPSIK